MRVEVKCVYCKEIMGLFSEDRKTVDEDGRESVAVELEDSLELSPSCLQSPDGQHANMTPEQAKTRGLA